MSVPPTTFADVATTSTRSRRCRKCGAKNAGQVRLMILEAGGQAKLIATRSETFCEACAVATYTAMLATLEGDQ